MTGRKHLRREVSMMKFIFNKIYRKIFIAAGLAIIFSMTGCNADKYIDSSNSTERTSMKLNSQEEDAQPYWNTLSSHMMAKGEIGYYYIRGHGIRYFDPDTETNIPLCAKPECQHKDDTCNAAIGFNKGYFFSNLYYYKGYLYVMKEVNGTLILEQISQDGTNRKDLFEIDMPTRYSGHCNVGLIFYKDCVYIYDSIGLRGKTEEGDVTIRCRSLDGKKDEIIYTYTGVSCFIECGKVYGGKLFFCVNEGKTNPETKQNSMTGKGLYAYDIDSGKTDLVIDKPVCDYAVDVEGNVLYYFVTYEGLYKMDLSTGESQLLLSAAEDTKIVNMSFDGKYLYLDNGRWWAFHIVRCSRYMIVLDTQGNEINRMEVGSGFFGDENYAFAQNDSNVYLPKKDIATAKEWLLFPKE